MEQFFETMILRSRWVLAPMYLGLVGGLLVLLVKFGQEFLHIIMHIHEIAEREAVLSILALVDITLVANLLIMVIIGGYEIFVSRLDLQVHPDRPDWLKHVSAGSIKVKVAMALIGISSIHLLKSFINAEQIAESVLLWQVVIHVTFLISAIALAYTDRLISQPVHAK